uniref:G-protein coupled receptors family 1 profile domain-containing protein n=1 Tax=Acrobeloides nanus TaxID=290746 RepID=A0A914CKU9_9BILA
MTDHKICNHNPISSSSISSREFIEFYKLLLPSPNGTLVPAVTLDPSSWSQYCDINVVSNFAKFLVEESAKQELACSHFLSEVTFKNLSLTTIFLIIGIIGLVGNLLTIAVICQTPALQTFTNYFLANLAFSDFMLIIIGVPFDLFHLWKRNQAPTFIGYCEFTSTMISWFTYISIFTIVALTAERFVAICYPFSLISWFDKPKVLVGILAIWIVTFFPSFYLGMQFKQLSRDFCGKNHQLESGIGKCDFNGSIQFRYTFEVKI